MPIKEQEFVELGSRYSTARLLEQARVSLAVAEAHAAELGKMFGPERITELRALIESTQANAGTQADKKQAAATGNAPVAVAMRQAKDWMRRLVGIADNAFEEEPELRDEFHKSGTVGRSVPKAVARLTSLLAAASAHKEALLAWGLDEDALETGKTLAEALADANTNQEVAVRDLPAATRALYELKGRLYLTLKRLARAGRTTLDPASARKLSLDVLSRTGGKTSASKPQAAPSVQEANPA